VRLGPLWWDLAAAALIATLIVIVSPGVAVAGIVAIVLLALCGVSLLWGRWRAR
jgi:hypothetical protein